MDFCLGNNDASAAFDVALIRLDDRVPLSRVRPLHPALTPMQGCSAFEHAGNFFGYLIGYGSDNGTISVRRFSGQDGWSRQSETCSVLPLKCTNSETEYENHWALTSHYYGGQPGDSGGALVADNGGSVQYLCGIVSNEYTNGVGTHFSYTAGVDSDTNIAFLKGQVGFNGNTGILDSDGNYRGECDPARVRYSNASLDLDADGDGLPDACDPCPTTPDLDYARTGIIKNYGPDDDHDGVADLCDSCPASLCDLRGIPRAECVNPPPVGSDGKLLPQPDMDHDHIGDSCDLCPGTPDYADLLGNGPDLGDKDGDGVGNACDDCVQFNPTNACLTDAECIETLLDGSQKQHRCARETTSVYAWGRCEGSGLACSWQVHCADGAQCEGIGSYGRCDVQLDDADQDYIGGICDTCPAYASKILANTNDIAETRQGADHLEHRSV